MYCEVDRYKLKFGALVTWSCHIKTHSIVIISEYQLVSNSDHFLAIS